MPTGGVSINSSGKPSKLNKTCSLQTSNTDSDWTAGQHLNMGLSLKKCNLKEIGIIYMNLMFNAIVNVYV